MVTSASVSGRRNARCPNEVMNAFACRPRRSGAFAGTRRAERGRVAGHLVGQLLRGVEELRAQLLGDEQGVGFVVEADAARRPMTPLSMSEMSVSLSRSRTAFDHCCRLSRATRGVATSTAAGGEDGIAYGSPPRPVLPWPAVP